MAVDPCWRALNQLEAWLETSMVGLSGVWLGLLVVELGRSPPPQAAGVPIWIAFVLKFVLGHALAPR